MLTPTFANRLSWFYAVGNTPATNLTRSVPHGQDADILTLGCGDARNVLFTAYVCNGHLPRRLDITCCDVDERIIGRNIILFTFIIDADKKVTDAALWDIYYHLYVRDATAELVLRQTRKLLPLLESTESWNNGPYSRVLKFCDRDSLDNVRCVCQRVLQAAQKRSEPDSQSTFRHCLKVAKEIGELAAGNGVNLSGLRSAAPLSTLSGSEIPLAYAQYWEQGTVALDRQRDRVPNPMFAALVSEVSVLHYGTDPILGFHLAAAFAPLSDNSPLKPENTASFRAASAAKTQFGQWVAAFRRVIKKKMVLRFVVADVFAFCHTLQHAAVSGRPSANWYRRQWDMKPLILDERAYGMGKEGCAAFDTIDTSNLSDHVGVLNVLIATAPLLKQKPWATVYTELMIKRHESQVEAFGAILCGHAPTVSLLLGLSPVQYWTNAKCESHVEETFLDIMGAKLSESKVKDTQLHSRLAWKRDDQFSGQLGGRGLLHLEAQTVSCLLFHTYMQMFEGENFRQILAGNPSQAKMAYCHFHRGTFTTLLKLVMNRVKTDWPQVFSQLIDTIARDRIVALSTNMLLELFVHMHLQGVGTQPWLLNELKPRTETGPLSGWSHLPLTVAMTLVVPREALDRLYKGSPRHKLVSPHLVAFLRASKSAARKWENWYCDVQLAFGNIQNESANEDSAIVVEHDEHKWEGSAPLVASFVIPTAALQLEPMTATVGLSVMPSVYSSLLYEPILGLDMPVFQTELGDEQRVFVSKHMPGQVDHRVDCGGVRPFEDTVGEESRDQKTKISAEIPVSASRISTLTGHVAISSDKGKDLLQDKSPITLRQKGPFVIEVVFGNDELVCPLRFPVPVTKAGSKTRIARTSGHVEVVAPLADPAASEALVDFLFPAELSMSRLPVALNMPHVNLDNLPILDLEAKDRMTWLTLLTSLQFSTREKKLRDITSGSGISKNLRVNFKESLFTMFMLVSGLQGGQTGMFAINNPERGGIHMLIIVSAMRLDGDSASAVLDAAVLPFTTELIESRRMEQFLLLIRKLECCTIKVNDAELILWKKLLPSMAERCRTWNHLSRCEYRREGATMPLSVEPGKQVLCSCGNGKFPKNYLSLPQWDEAAANAVRIAISPTYAVPFVEDVTDPFIASAMGVLSLAEKCLKCGKTEEKDGVKLKVCKRCLKAKYCSVECQKYDWKKHCMECKEKD